MLVVIDETVAVQRKDIMSAEVTPDTKVKLIFTYGGHVKTDKSLDDITSLLNLLPINKLQAVNPDVVSSVVMDKEFKTRVFADGGGFLYSDHDFKTTVEMVNNAKK